MARICIITPGSLGSNPRAVKEASALAQAGHDVHVIATRWAANVDKHDKAILATAKWTCERIDLRFRINRGLLKIYQVATARLHSKTSDGPIPSLSTGALMRRATAWPADLYIAHYVAALPAAAMAARQNKAKYAFDAEDFHPGDLSDTAENADANQLIRQVEGRWLPGCAYVTAASPGIALAYETAYGIDRPTVVLNVFPKNQALPEPRSKSSAQPGPTVYWFSQTIGSDRGLECAVRAIALSQTRPYLHLRGTLAAGFKDALVTLAASEGVADRLNFHEPESPLLMEALAAQYDAGLVAETGSTPNRCVALSNKQFTYLLAGIPILMSDTPGHRNFAQLAEGAAFLFKTEDAVDLARVLDELLGHPARLAASRAEAYRLGQDRFNWEIEQRVLTKCIDKALATANHE